MNGLTEREDWHQMPNNLRRLAAHIRGLMWCVGIGTAAGVAWLLLRAGG